MNWHSPLIHAKKNWQSIFKSYQSQNFQDQQLYHAGVSVLLVLVGAASSIAVGTTPSRCNSYSANKFLFLHFIATIKQ